MNESTLVLLCRLDSQGVLGTPLDKISVAVRRFNLVKQRLLKQIRGGTLFPGSSNLVISPIKSIKGISAPGTIRYVLGTVSEMVEGSYSLEDPEDFISLDFSQLKQTPQDFIVEGSIILVKAVCLANRLLVESILVPPAEARIETMSMLSHPDIMEATNFAQPIHELQILEKQAKRSRFVVLSDVWLDQPSIYNRLQVLFDGFNAQNFLPEVFVMIGPFTSTPPKDGPRAWSHYQDLFDNFASFVERIKNARNVRFVFVPAGNDPGFMESLAPRPPMPAMIFDSWRRANLDFVAASNPCRLVYFTQEIVIYRQELTNQLRKHDLKLEAVRNPDESGLEEDLQLTQISEGSQKPQPIIIPDQQKTCKTLLDQASLSPFSLSTKAQMWNYDHVMTMYPVPDALIVAERQASYAFNYEGCSCANPGSFPSSEGSFLMYNPSQKTFELCEIPK